MVERGWKPAQGHCSFQNLNVLSVVQVLYFYVGLVWATYPHSPWWSGLLRKTLFLVDLGGGLWWFTGANVFSKTEVTLQSPWCWGKLDFLHYLSFPEMVWFLSFSTELSSTGRGGYRGCWSLWFKLFWYFVLPIKIQPPPLFTIITCGWKPTGRERKPHLIPLKNCRKQPYYEFICRLCSNQGRRKHTEFCSSEQNVAGRFLHGLCPSHRAQW